MKIVTFAAIKGGVGKTTITYNYGEWLAGQGKHVLLIDLDHQCNLSQDYKIMAAENTVGNIFSPDSDGKVEFHHVKKNVDLLAGDMNLDKKEESIDTRPDKNMRLYMWLSQNLSTLKENKYDYILIDTHPDFSTSTKNAIVVSHDVISPITPSEHGYKAKWNLELRFDQFKKEALNYETGKSFVTANLYFVANMIKKRTTTSKNLLERVKDPKERCIAIIPEKELFNRTQIEKIPISEMKENRSIYNQNKGFFKEVQTAFETITDKL